MAAEMDMEFDAALAAAAAPVTGEENATADSRWSSTSSAESELNNFWHDSTALNHFYTTQDTVNSLDSFDFNDDKFFFGPFNSCSTGLSQHQTQDSIRHMTEAGIESIDFASTQLCSGFPNGLNLDHPQPMDSTDHPLDMSLWPLPTVVSDSTSSLKDRLNSALVRGDGGRLFVPDDALSSILAPHSVLAELCNQYPAMTAQELQQLAARITANDFQGGILTTDLLRTFAVLLLLEKSDKIVAFSQEGLSDSSLPLTKVAVAKRSAGEAAFELRGKDAPDVQLHCIKSWSEADLEALERLQWRVVIPKFSDIAKEQDVDFLDLEDQTVLPYVESWENKKNDHYKGGNSEVWKVKIHDAHHKFQNMASIVPNNHYFAIKKLKSKDDEAFRREVHNLQRLHNAEHPNLLTLLATYKYKGYYHLVFPWADGDLRRLWQSTPNPQAGKEEMRWLASQCASIASALKSVHAGAESWMQGDGSGTRPGLSDKQRLAMNKYGIHGDIKPENIFIFAKGQQKSFKAALAMGPPHTADGGASTDSERSSRSGSPSSVADEFVMSIGDFGGGEFFDPSSNPDPLRQITVAYRPPEYDTKLRPISRSWDVWGLGCTYLEFVTWFLLGPTGLTEFARRRTTRTAAGKLSDEYFDVVPDDSQTGGVGAILKGSVLAWMNDLRRHRNASPFIREFLDFITHRMFIVENASLTRASGAEVADYLNDLVRLCFDSDAYCLPSPAASSAWEVESTASTSTGLTALSPENFGLDFATASASASTEDIGAGAAAPWHFSSLDDDVNALAQWNTAPILPAPSAASAYPSLSCADLLGSWNYTAPVSWNNSNGNGAGSSSVRKRKLDASDEDLAVRRVSPKSSNPSPQTTTTSTSRTVDESPVTVTEATGPKAAEKRFACPYYKNNPGKFRQKRTCCGPGWPTVHRVKEHLYRCHTIGKHTCSRCLKRCKSSADLLAHQRAAVSCDTRTDAFPEGTMLPSQEETLRVKKRVPPNTTEEQRWNEVYMVLFPDAGVDSLPTPFYEDEPAEPPRPVEPSTKPDDDSSVWFCSSSDYEEYLSRSLPPRVQRELERQVQHEFGFFGDTTQTRRVVDMVQQMQLRLFKQYEKGRNSGLEQPDSGV